MPKTKTSTKPMRPWRGGALQMHADASVSPSHGSLAYLVMRTWDETVSSHFCRMEPSHIVFGSSLFFFVWLRVDRNGTDRSFNTIRTVFCRAHLSYHDPTRNQDSNRKILPQLHLGTEALSLLSCFILLAPSFFIPYQWILMRSITGKANIHNLTWNLQRSGAVLD